jgi:hypothetical protein
MLPLWLGTGPGSEERRSIAVVVIGGQSLCLLLTLIMTPVAYSLLDDLAQSPRWHQLFGFFRRAGRPPTAGGKPEQQGGHPETGRAAQ